MAILLLCIKIFFVRIIDVSLGTIRTIITVKGKAIIASTVGFFEVLVWFLIVREALNTNTSSIWIAISYSLGFATGTYVGSKLSDKFIKGTLGLQIITSKKDYNIVKKIRENGHAVSVLELNDSNKTQKYMLFMEINKKHLDEVKSLIKEIDSNAFIVVNETKYVKNGYFKDEIKK